MNPISFMFLIWLGMNSEAANKPQTPVLTSVNQESYFHHCGFDDILREAEEKNTQYWQNWQALEEDWLREQRSRQGHPIISRNNDQFVIPVVVHIVHNNGPENIPDQQIQQGIDHLNQAFSNIGYYDQQTGADVGIQFCMAKQDPQGNLTNGITRTVSNLTDIFKDTEDLDLKNLSRWAPDCYLNIWVVNSITGFSGPGVAGYAYLPSAHGLPFDGIVAEAAYFGTSPKNSTVLVHEAGHYLGLYHTFEGGCSNSNCMVSGDRVCDTPPDQSTAPVPCDLAVNTCSTDTNSGFATDQNDMTNNYLDYGDLACYNAFTTGQVERMQFFLSETRASLLSCKSCQDPCMTSLDIEIQNPGSQAVGSTVLFTTTQNNVEFYQWWVNGNTLGTNSTQDHTFDNLDSYEIVVQGTGADPNCVVSDTLIIQTFCDQPAQIDIMGGDTLQVLVNEATTISTTTTNTTGYEWWVNGVSSGASQNLNYTFPSEGLQQVVVQGVGNYLDCSARDTAWVNVYCPITATIEADIESISVDETVNFTATTNGSSGEWLINGQSVGNGFMLSHTFSTAGVYEVEFLASATNCSTKSNAILIYVGDVCYYEDNPSSFEMYPLSFAKKIITSNDGGYIQTYSSTVVKMDSSFNAIWSISISDMFSLNQIFRSPDGQGYIVLNEYDRIIKISEEGEVLWARDILMTTDIGFLLIESVIELSDGNFAILGFINTGSNFTVDHYIFVIKFDPDGNLIWEQIFNYCRPIDLTEGSDGSVFVLVSAGFVGQSFGLIKIDPDGQAEWAAAWQNAEPTAAITGAIELLSDNTLFVMFTHQTFNFNPEIIGIQVLNLSENAEILSSKLLTLPDAPDFYYIFDMERTTENEILFIGGYDDASNTDVGLYGKLNEAGDFIWFRQQVAEFQPNYITKTKPDEILISGYSDFNSRTIIANDLGLSGICEVVTPNYSYDDYSHTPVPFPIGVGNFMLFDTIQLNSNPNPVWRRSKCLPEDVIDVSLDVTNLIHCGSDIELFYTVCNVGTFYIFDNLPISIYLTNPTETNAQPFYTIPVSAPFYWDECTSSSVSFPAPPIGTDSIFVMINDDGTFPTPFNLTTNAPEFYTIECASKNNFDSFPIPAPATVSEFSLGIDTLICPGEQITLYGPSGYDSYQWQDGSNDSTLMVTSPGMYHLTVSSLCGGSTADTIQVLASTDLELDLGPDILLCQSGVTAFDAGPGFSTYRWQDGSPNQTHTAFEPGRYWVEATDYCGAVFMDTIEVVINPNFSFDLGEDRIICAGDSVAFDIQSAFSSYQWYPDDFVSCADCGTTVIKPSSSTKYVLIGMEDGDCFSSDTINIIVQEFQTQESQQICEGDSILIFGNFESQAGTYSATFSSLLGCDSLHTIELEVLSNSQTQEDQTICDGETADIFGTPTATSGTYAATFSAMNGCDSTHTINLSVLDPVLTEQNLSICQGEVIDIFGTPTTTAGTYQQSFTANNGCDSTHTINLQVLDFLETQESLTICEGETIDIFGTPTTTAGTFVQTFIAQSGCDSTHTIVLDVLDHIETQASISTCQGQAIDIFGTPTSMSGNYAQTFTAQNGCDSTHTISLTVQDTFFTLESISICQGETADIFGTPTATSGTYAATFSAMNGCDSTHTINLSVLDPVLTAQNLSICQGEVIDIFGTPTTTAGTYQQSFIANNGCDSTHTINLQVLDFLETQESLTICEGETIDIFGTPTTTAGTFVQTFTAQSGCDSTHTIVLDVLDHIETQASISTCQGQPIDIFGTPTSMSGNYAQTFTALNGCDSTHTISLTVQDTFFTTETLSICQGETADIFGTPTSTNGTYIATFSSMNGCDSTHTIILSVLQPILIEEDRSICEGEAIDIFGTPTTTAGTYQQSFTANNGCDSTHTINLQVLDFLETQESLTICEGETIDIFGTPTTTAGTFVQTFTAQSGCDSTHTIVLDVLDHIDTQASISTCQGQAIDIFGTPTSMSGNYAQTFTAQNGCDSTHTISLTVQDTFFTTETLSICQGETTDIFGTPTSTNGTYIATFSSMNGCDSTHTIILSVLQPILTEEDRSICEGEAIDIFGTPTTTAGTYQQSFTATNDCDSTHAITLEVLSVFETQEELIICEGEEIEVFGTPTSTAGTYAQTIPAENGCDSTHIIILDVLLNIQTEANLSICQGQSIDIFGEQVSESGTFSQISTAQNGCDSTHTITLDVLPVFETQENISICQGQSIYIFGNPVSTAGIYSEIFASQNGCDSTHTIDLEVFEAVSSTSSLNICEGEIVDIFGMPTSEPGLYEQSYTLSNGCDSLARIELHIWPEIDYNVQITDVTCIGESNGGIEIIADNSILEVALNNGDFSNQTIFENLLPGPYTITIRDENYCLYAENIQIPFPASFEIVLPEVIDLTIGDSVKLLPVGDLEQVVSYFWEPPFGLSCNTCPSPSAQPLTSQTYTLTVWNEQDCEVSSSTTIRVQKDLPVFIPNAFSPNSDGFNDFFKPFGKGNYTLHKFIIFDRWGAVLFEAPPTTMSQLRGWDGQFNNQPVNNGVYVYLIEVEVAGQVQIYSGDLLLLR